MQERPSINVWPDLVKLFQILNVKSPPANDSCPIRGSPKANGAASCHVCKHAS